MPSILTEKVELGDRMFRRCKVARLTVIGVRLLTRMEGSSEFVDGRGERRRCLNEIADSDQRWSQWIDLVLSDGAASFEARRTSCRHAHGTIADLMAKC